MSKSTPVLESEKSEMKTQMPASLVVMCCSPAIAIQTESKLLPSLLNNHPAQVRPQPAAPPGTSAVLSQRPWTPAASARRRRLRAPGCGCG